MRHVMLLCLLLCTPSAWAEVYKWVDEKGVVHYTDKPPTDNSKPADLPPLQTYKGGEVPKLKPSAVEAKPKPAPPKGLLDLVILEPAAEETLRDNEGNVAVSVGVAPGMPPGHRVVYYMDGVPQALPTEALSYVITNVERGTHTVAASVVDATGQEVAAAPPVTFHMQATSILAPRGPQPAPRAPSAPPPLSKPKP